MAYDIQRLRQQQIFQPQPYEDMSGMGEQYGMGMGGGGMVDYAPSTPFLPPRSQGPLEQIGQQPSTGPRTPEQGVISSEMPQPNQIPADPTRTPAGASPLRTSGTTAQEIIDLINKQYTPETIDRDRLRKLMDAAPEREEPSIMRRIVAGGIGIGSKTPIEDMEKVMYAPHHRAMDDWKTKAEPFSKTADLEGRANVNERTLAGNVASAAVQIDRTEAQRIRDEGKQAVAEKKAESERIRSIAYAYKAQGWTIKQAGDRIVAVRPPTAEDPNGEYRDLGDSGSMDQRDLEILKGGFRVDAAKASGQAALDRAIVAGEQVVVLPDGTTVRINPRASEPGGGAKPAQTIPGVTNPTRIGTPARGNSLESTRQEQARYEDLYVLDTTARKWIRKGTNGKFEMKNRPIVGSGKTFGVFGEGVTQNDVDDWDAVKAKVDPTYKPPAPGIGPAGSGKPAETKPQGIGPTAVPGAPEKAPTVGTGRGTGYNPNRGKLIETEEDRTLAAAREAVAARVASNEVVVRDKKTGKEFAMRKENLKKALDTGLYEQVK